MLSKKNNTCFQNGTDLDNLNSGHHTTYVLENYSVTVAQLYNNNQWQQHQLLQCLPTEQSSEIGLTHAL